MKVELLDSMGNDLTVVNAARVSFDKEHIKVEPSDHGLIRYLAKHQHWSPFAHCFVQLRIEAPIFVARQLQKHQVGLSWNELSRRYVNSPPEFWDAPMGWREAAEDKKQGSGRLSPFNREANLLRDSIHKSCSNAYDQLIGMGICEEQARSILPQSMMTEWFWSGSLYAFSRVCNLRNQEDAQKETQIISLQIDSICDKLYPISWKALMNREYNPGEE